MVGRTGHFPTAAGRASSPRATVAAASGAENGAVVAPQLPRDCLMAPAQRRAEFLGVRFGASLSAVCKWREGREGERVKESGARGGSRSCICAEFLVPAAAGTAGISGAGQVGPGVGDYLATISPESPVFLRATTGAEPAGRHVTLHGDVWPAMHAAEWSDEG